MKILVVEDDVLTCEVLVTILTNQNYAAEVANDGEAAWELIQTYDYDLILLDVLLPKLDGISLCRQIRAQGLRVPILLLTGRDSSHDKALGLNAGADDYLVKPFDEEELIARIHALLRRGTISSQPILEVGELQLDPRSCEVNYSNKLLTLTPKEYGLLELFMRNTKRVFSCGMILEHLWSYDEMPGEEAVRTHIKGLRQKLKAVGAPSDFIETVYGIGYRLKPQQLTSHNESNQNIKSKVSTTKSNHQTSAQQTLTAIALLWQKFKGRVDEQVNVLVQTANALTQNNLNSELRISAQQEAHTLAGSLGTFGFEEGSKLARKIEKLLKDNQVLGDIEIAKINSFVQALVKELEQPPHPQANKSINTQDESSLLLIIDKDTNVIEQIAQESTNRNLKFTVATNLDVARSKIYQEHPHIILLDPSISKDWADSLGLLVELKRCKPAVPVIVLTKETDFSNRLLVARSGVYKFLQKPILPSLVIDTVSQVLHQADFAEAKILAVDDDPKILALLQTLLSPWGIKVYTLSDPKCFWETFKTTKPDLLILDVEMPEANGIELCQVVRNDPDWSDLPILFLTVHTDADVVNQVFSVGADDFVSKPIVGPELVTRIINRLERIKLRRRMSEGHEAAEIALRNSQESLLRTKEELELRIVRCTNELNQANYNLQSELEKRLQSQEALRTSQALFSGIVGIADDAIISIDSKQCITLFNSGAEKIFGYEAREVLGKPLDILLPKRYRQVHQNHVSEFGSYQNHARRMAERQEIYGQRKDGSEFPAEASISKLKLGESTVYTVYLQDISERKQIERMKDEFVSVVSHELRTPLTSIHGSLGMLASGLIHSDSEQGKRLLQIATDSTERLVRLINDILDIERIESGRVKMEKQTCNVADLITEAVNTMQPIADKAHVSLNVHSLPINIWADSDRIIQTLTNLLSNAIKFSKQGSCIDLKIQQQENLALFTVCDSGRGIPQDKLESIFERFQQVDASDSRKQDGTGLGLAICKSIVQQHDGRIWVESVVGQGSTFYFTIPISQSTIAQELKVTKIKHNKRKVLICDDDAASSNKLKSLLEQRGYYVIVVESGEAAIQVASSEHPDVILLDLVMPGMNGWEVMAVLKQKRDTEKIPIIICSICTPENELSEDFAEWVCKPIKSHSLLRLLSQVLGNVSHAIRVLVVEDDDNIAQLIATHLQGYGIESFIAKTGKEAIHKSQEINPDLIILDLILPEYDGFEVVEWLQQHHQLYNVPLLVYSARDLNDSERIRLKLGHTEFLTKEQLITQEFEQKVMELIGRITQNLST